MESDRFQLEVLLSLQVKHELEGLTKSDRTERDAKAALDLIRKNNFRCVTSKGGILQGRVQLRFTR